MTATAARKTLSLVLLLAAIAWAADVVRQVMAGAGPPLGALCISVPAALLLVAAGAAWPASPTKPVPTWIYAAVVVGIAIVLLYLKLAHSPD